MIEDPFADYPDFGRVLDQMSQRGLHLYYHGLRTVFKDDGTKWRERWESSIRIWMRKAGLWDTFSKFLATYILSDLNYQDDMNLFTNNEKIDKILEKIRRAIQAQENLSDLQRWLLLDAKMNYSPQYFSFIEKSLTEWKTMKGEQIPSQLFEVVPKGTMEQIREVEHILQYIEGTTPIGKIDGLNVHSSEVLEYVRLWLRFTLGLPPEQKNKWSVRDVKRVCSWTRVGKKLGYEVPSEQIGLSRAPDRHLTDPHTQ